MQQTAPPPYPPPSPSATSCSSLDSFQLDGDKGSATSESDIESVTDVMDGLRCQMEELNTASHCIRKQMKDLCKKAKDASIDWKHTPLQPQTKELEAWMVAHGLPAQPSLDLFLEACLDAAKSIDFETRTVTFDKKDAVVLWGGEQQVSLFNLLSRLPGLFA